MLDNLFVRNFTSFTKHLPNDGDTVAAKLKGTFNGASTICFESKSFKTFKVFSGVFEWDKTIIWWTEVSLPEFSFAVTRKLLQLKRAEHSNWQQEQYGNRRGTTELKSLLMTAADHKWLFSFFETVLKVWIIF